MRPRFSATSIGLLVVSVLTFAAPPAIALDIFLKCDAVPGTSTVKGREDWIPILGMSESIERESTGGPKGGTEDINIGVGEFAPVSLLKRYDASSNVLRRFAVNGNAIARCEIDVESGGLESGGSGFRYSVVLHRSFVSGFSSSAESDGQLLELLTIRFNQIEWSGSGFDGGNETRHSMGGWDLVKNLPFP